MPLSTRASSVFSRRAGIRATIVFSAALLAACQADSVVAAPKGSAPDFAARTDISAAAIQLWSELAPVSGVLIGTPAGAVITPANDFVVPPRTAWTVSSIVLRGVKVVATPIVTVSLAFRANGIGQPGALIQRVVLTAVSQTPVDQTNQSDFQFDLAQPVTLGAGTYWLETQCSASLIECGLGPVVGQQAFTTTDDGVTWTPGFPTADGPSDNLFALLGTVDTPESRIVQLETTVASLGLDRATENKLETRLQTALADLGSGDVTGACAAMQDFIDLARLKAGKKLTSAQAAALIDAATGIRALIGC